MAEQDDYNKVIADIFADHRSKLHGVLINSLNARNIVLSSELLNSLKVQVQSNASSVLNDIIIEFNSYGRVKEIQGGGGGKLFPVDEIAKTFVEKIGIDKFKYVPGYQNTKRSYEDIPNASKRIAFAIGMKRMERGNKARKWYIKNTFNQVFGDEGIVNALIDAIPAEFINQVRQLNTEIKLGQ